MDGENNGKTYEQMGDLGGKPPILGNPHKGIAFQHLSKAGCLLDGIGTFCYRIISRNPKGNANIFRPSWLSGAKLLSVLRGEILENH